MHGFIGALDFIYAHGFTVASSLELVAEEELRPYTYLPNPAYGSDHLSVAVDLVPSEL